MKAKPLLASALLLASLQALGQSTARHIADLDRAGFIAAPTGEAPEMTAVAGPRFLDLVPESQREICRMVLERQAQALKGLYRLRVVDARGNDVMRCTL